MKHDFFNGIDFSGFMQKLNEDRSGPNYEKELYQEVENFTSRNCIKSQMTLEVEQKPELHQKMIEEDSGNLKKILRKGAN
jgi:hypothetical protein